jgi:hypothetical protein
MFAGRVSPTIANSREETEPPEAVTVPLMVVGDDPDPEPLPVPDPGAGPAPESAVHVVVPALHPVGGAWHLLAVLSQYHPP